MSYIDSILLPDERILYRGKMHWIILLPPLLWLGLTVILSMQDSILILLAYVSGVVTIVTAIGALAQYMGSEYVITNKRILVKTGFIRRYSVELLLRRIEGIQIKQSFLGRLFDYGTIVVIGTGGTRDPFHLVANPLNFRNQVQKEIEKLNL